MADTTKEELVGRLQRLTETLDLCIQELMKMQLLYLDLQRKYDHLQEKYEVLQEMNEPRPAPDVEPDTTREFITYMKKHAGFKKEWN